MIRDAMRQKIFKMYDTSIYPMVKKLVKEMAESIDFEGTSLSRPKYRILKDNLILTHLTFVADY